jgi:hypothetical protein
MQNKANLKTEVRKQKLALSEVEGTEDSKIMAESTPKLRLSRPPTLFDNCRESSTNRPYFGKAKPISVKPKRMYLSLRQRIMKKLPPAEPKKQSQPKPISKANQCCGEDRTRAVCVICFFIGPHSPLCYHSWQKKLSTVGRLRNEA